MKFKIDKQEYEAFLQTLPVDIRQECFTWLISRFDVPKALFLIHKHNLEVGEIGVEAWAKGLGMAGELELREGKTSWKINMLTGVTDDDAVKPHINPDIPVVIVEHTWGRGKQKESGPLLIDGNHRLRKAFLEKREKIKAYYLPKELTKLVYL
jgi:hypothetical protein